MPPDKATGRGGYMKAAVRFLMLAGVSLMAGSAWGQESGWPRVVKDGATQIVVYQPQPDSIDGITLQSRVAISIKRPQDKAPLFGALWVIATLDVDRDRDLARIASIKVDRTRFADIPDNDIQFLSQFLEREVPLWDLSISLTRLRTSLQLAGSGPEADYRNDPPKIVVVDYPAILLLLDGDPKMQEAGPGGLQRLVNTALPVITIRRRTSTGSSGQAYGSQRATYCMGTGSRSIARHQTLPIWSGIRKH